MKLDRIVCWTSTAITIISAVLISVNVYPLGPIVSLIGSVGFITWSTMIRDRAMITVNSALFVIYGTGLLIHNFMVH